MKETLPVSRKQHTNTRYTFLYKKWFQIPVGFVVIVILFTAYSLLVSPYSKRTIVQQPFTTSYTNGQVVLVQHFVPRVYSGWLASTLAYFVQADTDIWDRIRSPKEPVGSVASIEAAIHAQRFDPSKPYIISGDQFEGLYLRNMSIFYQDLLNPHTALSTTDWHNRERIAVQSLAYGLAATQQLKYPVTTLLPISSRGVIAVNFWNYPSDTMFSLFSMLQSLEANPDTKQAALQLQKHYGSGLQAAYQNYLATVRDPHTGFVRSTIHISSARDAAQRESSFYDTVILWKTEQQASQLGYDHVSEASLANFRQEIITRYWDQSQGHFIDDVSPGNQHSYSSDWLIVLPLGFLDPKNPQDLTKLKQISSYIDAKHLTDPLPIRYTADASTNHQAFFVKYFVGNYGNTAIWSYWGDLYITMQTALYQQTHDPLYAQHVTTSLRAWKTVIVRDQGYPETLDAQGKMLEEPVYESIRRNGWIVDFEADEYNWKQTQQGVKSTE